MTVTWKTGVSGVAGAHRLLGWTQGLPADSSQPATCALTSTFLTHVIPPRPLFQRRAQQGHLVQVLDTWELCQGISEETWSEPSASSVRNILPHSPLQNPSQNTQKTNRTHTHTKKKRPGRVILKYFSLRNCQLSGKLTYLCLCRMFCSQDIC